MFFTDNINIMYVANPKEFADKLLQLSLTRLIDTKIVFLKNTYFYIPGKKELNFL